ncbi:hypothetical protein, partial [Bradyrhizobium sp.]|uniref:hypothetical protein n=1 Tax=Bradyrhizobium sp. TaxID=376 RepID=UPI003C3674DB
MNWAWAALFDSIWRSPAFPMWVTMAAAGFFGIIVLITLVRAEKSVANGALTVITLLAVGIAAAATIRVYGGPASRDASDESRPVNASVATLPAMACLDDLAGDTVLSACEKVLFGSAESAASAVAYTASQITRLTSLGDADVAEPNMTPELRALRRAVERDRYGLVAQVLQARDHCMATQCAAFRSLTDTQRIMANMDQHAYDGLVARYAPSWNAPVAAAGLAGGPLAALGASVPTGRPTNIDFPSAASTPAVSIMTPEPGTAGSAQRSVSAPAAAANAALLSPRPTSASPA